MYYHRRADGIVEKGGSGMPTEIVFTLTGPDRVGIVEDVSEALLSLRGNIATSRMVRLGGEFAVLMLVSLPAEAVDDLEAAFVPLTSQGYTITTRATEERASLRDWPRYRLDVRAADREGVLHEIAHELALRGVSIESMEIETIEAPMSGSPLGCLSALVAVPPQLAEEQLRAELRDAGHRSNVDVVLTPLNAQ